MMEWNQLIWAVIPSVLSGIIIIRLNTFNRANERRDQTRKKESILILQNLDAIGSLSEQATKCLKGEKINGELDRALEYRKQMKHELERHLMEVNAEMNCRRNL